MVGDSFADALPVAATGSRRLQAPPDLAAQVRARTGLIFPLLLSLLPVLLFSPFVKEPLDGDAGVYATVARGMLNGQIPYRDVFDHKQPLTYGWYALSYLLFGEEGSSPRFLILFHLAATSMLVYWCGRLLFNSRSRGYLAALAFGLTPGLAMVTGFGDARFLMLTPLVAGFLAHILGYRTGQARWYLASGILNGLAAATLIIALFNFLALVAFTVWRGLARHVSYRREVAALLVGAAATLALTVLPFVITGTLSDFLYGNFTYNLGYTARPLLTPSRLLEVLGLGVLMLGPFLLAAGFGAWLLLRSAPREIGVLLGLWSLASVAGLVSTGRLPEHYLIGVFPALALLAAIALDWLRAGWRVPRVKACFLGTLPFIFLSLFFNLQPYLQSAGAGHLADRYAKEGFQRMVLMPEIGRYVAGRTASTDAVFFLGREPGPFYFYADRSPASRSILPCVFVNAGLSREVLADLERTRPVYILDALRPDAGCSQGAVRPALDKLLGSYYEYQGRLHFVDIYRLK